MTTMTDSLGATGVPDTPTLVVNEAIAQANITAFAKHCEQAGIALRPHIKTHKSAYFARAQLDAGAKGITCQKIGEAEVMADAGMDDILITYNILGASKLARLRALNERLARLSVVADNTTVIDGLSAAFADAARPLPVLVECDTGAKRCGVQTPTEALALAQRLTRADGVSFDGLMTYPSKGGAAQAADFMREARALLADAGIDCPVVSTGGTPDMWEAAPHGVFTEYRIGTYIYNDRSLMARGTCAEADCAARVLTTVVARPTADRAVIDAGSKVLTSDLRGLEGYGHVVGYPGVSVSSLSEEHGVLQLPEGCDLSVGQQVEVIPNHICVVSNMLDSVWLVAPSGAARQLPIDARGCVR